MHSMAPLGLIWVAPLARFGVHSSQGASQQWHLRATLRPPGAQVSSLLGHCLSCFSLGCCLCCCPSDTACAAVLCVVFLGAILWIMHAVTTRPSDTCFCVFGTCHCGIRVAGLLSKQGSGIKRSQRFCAWACYHRRSASVLLPIWSPAACLVPMFAYCQ